MNYFQSPLLSFHIDQNEEKLLRHVYGIVKSWKKIYIILIWLI